MATPSIMRRLGDKAKKYSPLPDENDFRGLKETENTVNEAAAAPAPEKKTEVVGAGERLNPNARYGDRPGEKRIDTSSMTKPLGSIPVYDDGGEVNTEDGKHQLAILQDGERVLTPEQNEALFPSATPEEETPRVLKNPDNVQPVDSESITPKQMKFPGGAKLNADNAPLSDPKMDISNPANAQIIPGGTGAEAMEANVPSSETLTGRKPKLDPNSPVGRIIQHDKEQAAAKGDLVGLGTALLNEKHLATDIGAQHDAGDMTHQAKLQDYDKRIQEAMDKAAQTNDPAFQEQADRLRLAKAQYEKNTPWGSAENHPGILGRIGHTLAKIGNVAGEVVAPGIMTDIPGTELNKQQRIGRLGQALRTDTQSRLEQEAEANKLKIAEAGKTPEQKTYNNLLTQVNPDTGKVYTHEEALAKVKQDEQTKEKESYIADQMKQINPTSGKNYTREEATESYYKMRAGTKPPNEKEQELKDYLKRHNMEDTPDNRDLARQEIIRRKTDITASANLPYQEQRARLSAQLAEDNQHLNQINANSLQRGEKADEYVEKENIRHNMIVKQIDAAQNALDASDTNMLAASIVPVLATMTETTAQGIKRLNPQELARFMPKSSGDARQWFEANYDKIAAGQIPTTYRADLRDLLNNLAKEEQLQNDSNMKSIDQTFKQGATTPVVNNKGRATTTEKSKPAHEEKPIEKPAGATHTGKSSLDGKYYWLDANQKKLGLAPAPTAK